MKNDWKVEPVDKLGNFIMNLVPKSSLESLRNDAKLYYQLREAVLKYKRALEAGEAYASVLTCEATKDLFEMVNDDKGDKE